MDGVKIAFIKSSAFFNDSVLVLGGRLRQDFVEKLAGQENGQDGESWAFSIEPLCWCCWG
jgi:hypothetical protein